MVAVADGDVAVSVGSSGCAGGGWGRGWGAVGLSGSECRRSEGPGGGSGAEGPVVVVVLNDVVIVDGGCVLGQHQNPTPWITCGLYKGTQRF